MADWWDNYKPADDGGNWWGEYPQTEGVGGGKKLKNDASVARDIRDKVAAVASGVNRAIPWAAGFPADTALNVAELLKIPAGVAYSELSGKAPPDWLSPVKDRASVPGTQAWIERGLMSNPNTANIITGGGAAQENPGFHAAGLGIGTTLATGRPANVPQAGIMSTLGGLSSILGEKVYEATGSPGASILAGLGIPATASAIDMGLRASLRPNAAGVEKALAAQREGIPVGPADVTDKAIMRSTRSVLSDIPLVRKISDAQRAAKESAYKSAVAKTFGANGLDPLEVVNAKNAITATMDRVYSNNDMVVDNPFRAAIRTIINKTDELPEHEATALLKRVKDLRSNIQTGPGGTPVVDGDFINNWQASIRRDFGGRDDTLGMRMQDLRRTVIKQFNDSVTNPDDVAALTDARTKYKAFKTLESLLAAGQAGKNGAMPGDLSAARLPGEVLKSYGDSVMMQNNVPDLARIAATGSRVVPERVLQTGGSPRSAIQNLMLLTGAGAAGLVGGSAATGSLLGGLGTVGALGAGAAGLNWALGSPRALNYAMSPQGPSFLPPAIGSSLSLEQIMSGNY